MTYWCDAGILKEHSNTVTLLQDRQQTQARVFKYSVNDPNATRQGNAGAVNDPSGAVGGGVGSKMDDDDEDDCGMDGVDGSGVGGAVNNEAAAALDALKREMAVYEQYIVGMLTNLDSLTTDRVHNMLKVRQTLAALFLPS